MRPAHLRLLPRNRLIKTGPVDYADWNYRAILGTIQRSRFALALSLLPAKSHRVLEVGYGSGIFLPSLCAVADEVYGIDVHDRAPEVTAALASQGLQATLVCSPAEKTPFAPHFFDAVVAISSLEFVRDLSDTCSEIQRILKPDGSFVVVTPGKSSLIDLGLRVLTGNSAEKDFGDRRESIVPTLRSYFTAKECRIVPPIANRLVCLYRGFRLTVSLSAGIETRGQ